MAKSRKLIRTLHAEKDKENDAKPNQNKDDKDKSQSQGQVLVAAISAAVEKGIGSGMKPLIDKQEAFNQTVSQTLEKISASQEELTKGLQELALGNLEAVGTNVQARKRDADQTADSTTSDGTADGTDDGTSDATVEANRVAADATDATMSADSTGSGDVDPTNFSDSTQDSTNADPGDLNPDATSNARAQSKGGSNQMAPGKSGHNPGIAASREPRRTSIAEISAAAKVIRTLRAQNDAVIGENRKLRNRVSAMEASLERYAERVERKSITPEISALLEKSGYDPREMMAGRQKLSVSEVDAMFLNSGVSLEPQMRAAFKNQLLQMNLMDGGEVRRWA